MRLRGSKYNNAIDLIEGEASKHRQFNQPSEETIVKSGNATAFFFVLSLTWLVPQTAAAQAPTCGTTGWSGFCMNVTVTSMFAGLGSPAGFDVRLSLPSTFVATVDPNGNGTSGICALYGVNQVRLSSNDSMFKEKWELIRTALVSGRRLWFEVNRESLTSSRCVFTYVGLM